VVAQAFGLQGALQSGVDSLVSLVRAGTKFLMKHFMSSEDSSVSEVHDRCLDAWVSRLRETLSVELELKGVIAQGNQ
jgi:hypothetical protein